jgi:hypothetical protein
MRDINCCVGTLSGSTTSGVPTKGVVSSLAPAINLLSVAEAYTMLRPGDHGRLRTLGPPGVCTDSRELGPTRTVLILTAKKDGTASGRHSAKAYDDRSHRYFEA